VAFHARRLEQALGGLIMFELESAIGQWRHEMATALGDQPEILDELESHLREEISQGGRLAAGRPRPRGLTRSPGSAAPPRWRRSSRRRRLSRGAGCRRGFSSACICWRWRASRSPYCRELSDREWGAVLIPHVFLILAGYLATMTSAAFRHG